MDRYVMLWGVEKVHLVISSSLVLGFALVWAE